MTLQFNVTHAQRRWDKPDDAPTITVITVKAAHGKPGAVYLTGPGLGCSRDFSMPADTAIRHWLTAEHAQTVLSIEPVQA